MENTSISRKHKKDYSKIILQPDANCFGKGKDDNNNKTNISGAGDSGTSLASAASGGGARRKKSQVNIFEK